MNKVIAIVGPTAVGKSALGLKLAKQINGQIISGDSMQIYRGLDIGTAKDTPEELSEVKHYLVDICDVDQRYTVKDFQQGARSAIEKITSENKIPIIVGGTGFYLSALVNNLNLGGDSDHDDKLRSELTRLQDKKGLAALQGRLSKIDPQAMQQIDIENPRRLIRAIEVYETTGHSITEQTNGNPFEQYYLVGLTDERERLYKRINHRVDLMVEHGLLDEVKDVYENQTSIPQAKNGIGYKELFPYFAGTSSLDDCLFELKKNSRHFAKRQLTYFRNQLPVNWVNISEEPDYYQRILTDIENFLQ